MAKKNRSRTDGKKPGRGPGGVTNKVVYRLTEYKELDTLLKLPMLDGSQYNRANELLRCVRDYLSLKDGTAISKRIKMLYDLHLGGDEHGEFNDRLPTKKRNDIIKLKTREFIYDSIGGEVALGQLVQKVFKQALKGSFKHQELLMNYLLGKPVEKIKLEALADRSNTNVPTTVFQIMADHARLNKLSGDIEALGETVSAERIKEMEKLLNTNQTIDITHEAEEDNPE